MILKVKDNKTGVIYTSDMSDENKHSILNINFCTSYTQVEVQDEILEDGELKYPTHDIILKPLGSKVNWIDLIAVMNDNDGEWINE